MPSLGGVQGALFKGRLCWGAARRQRGKAPDHPVGRKCAFDGSAVKSAFALLLEKVTKPAADAAKGRIDLYGLGLEAITV